MDLVKTCNFLKTLPWTFRWQKLQKLPFREKARKIIDLAKTLQLFEQTTMSLHFDELFRKKLQKWLISWKSTKNHGFGQNLQLFENTTMFWRFDELFSKKQKPPHFMKKHENSSIWPKLCNFFEQSTMFWCLDELFSKRLQKVKKHEKSSIWPKLCNFSNKLPCLCISMNFSGKSCKKWLISWKSTKNHRFGQNFATFGTNYHVFAFRWTFQEKVAKSASFREKAHFVKKHELFKSSIWPKLCNFSDKQPCFCISMNF